MFTQRLRRPGGVLAQSLFFALSLGFAGGASAGLLGLTVGGSSSEVESESDTTFSGRATGLVLYTPVTGEIVLADTGEQGFGPFSADATLVKVAVPSDPPIVTASILKAVSLGSGNVAESTAATLQVEVILDGLNIKAGVLQAHSEATCDEQGNITLSGHSEIAELEINGQVIQVSGEPNQTIEIPVGGLATATIIINEQTNPAANAIEVTALHVTVEALGAKVAEVIISRAKSDITCAGGDGDDCPQPLDFITGVGIIGDRPNRVSYGVHGGVRSDGSLEGHMNINDHSTNPYGYLTGNIVTAYEFGNPSDRDEPSRKITFNPALVNGVLDVCMVTLSDHGEGGDNDTFKVECQFTGFFAEGTLKGGGNQLHGPRCESVTDPNPFPPTTS